MLSRGFDIGNISSITNNLGSKISSFAGKITDVTKITSVKDAQKLLASVAGKSSSNTMNNETASVLSKACEGKGINKYNQDYLKNLERMLGIKNGMSLCDDSQVSELDRILMMSTSMNASRKSEYKTLINKTIGSELSELGYSGSIPSCLYGKFESLIDSLLSGVNGDVNLKLDLLNIFNNKCFNDTVGALASSNLPTKVGSLMTDSFLQNGDKDSATSYIANKYRTDPNNALGILGNSLSTTGNSDNASTKLMMYGAINDGSTGVNSTVINKGNLASNLDNDTTINKNSTGVMTSLSSVYKPEDSYHFAGKSNVSESANSYISNTKSTDSLNSTTKTTDLSLPSTVKLANLFG